MSQQSKPIPKKFTDDERNKLIEHLKKVMNVMTSPSHVHLVNKIYCPALVKFWECTPEDYVYKDNILECCVRIHDKLPNQCPTIVGNVFNEEIQYLLIPLMPFDTEKEPWALSAWNEGLIHATRVAKQFIDKEKESCDLEKHN